MSRRVLSLIIFRLRRLFFCRLVFWQRIWATDYDEIRSRAEAAVNAGTRTWCIGNIRRKLSSDHVKRVDGRPSLSNVTRGKHVSDYEPESSAVNAAAAPNRGFDVRQRPRVEHQQMFCISAASRCARPLNTPPRSRAQPTGHVARSSRSIETRSLPTLTHCFPRNFTFYVARPSRSILVGPALLVRFAQGARGAFTCAISSLGEF